MGEPIDPDVPCNMLALLNIRDGRLDWTQIIRSNDLVLGVPHNFVQFTFLQEVLAGWLAVEIGEYHQFSNSLHVYERDWEGLHATTTYEAARSIDDYRLPKEDSESTFLQLAEMVDEIRTDTLTADDVRVICDNLNLPDPYRNISRVLCAEAARRKRGLDTSELIMTECTNPALARLFELWMRRLGTVR
jgi:thymidylate synthase